MKTATTTTNTNVARPLAAEDLRPGDFVSLMQEVVEWPSFFWGCDAQFLPPHEPVRIATHPADCGLPLKIKAVCLPFVFVRLPSGEHRTLDVRRHRLARLTSAYARPVWKALSKRIVAKE